MTAQEWISNLSDGEHSRVATVNESDIRAIQSDALLEAAELLSKHYRCGALQVRSLILARVKELEVGK